MSKLLSYDFKVEYKAGKLNVAVDALSRRDEDEGQLNALSQPKIALFEAIKEEIANVKELQHLYQRFAASKEGADWRVNDGLIFYTDRVYLLPTSSLIQMVLSHFHNMAHEGIQKTLEKVKGDFFWKGMKGAVKDFVRKYLVCQQNKWENLHPAGLFQPLQVPSSVWANISMDFIEGLPKVRGKSALLAVVYRFSKYAHFMPLTHPYSTINVAYTFFEGIFRIHGLLESIVLDRDSVFTSLFWKELFHLSSTELALSSTYHPQADGQI